MIKTSIELRFRIKTLTFVAYCYCVSTTLCFKVKLFLKVLMKSLTRNLQLVKCSVLKSRNCSLFKPSELFVFSEQSEGIASKLQGFNF